MALFPPRACPSCQSPTITKPLDRQADDPFTCPVCGALVYTRFRTAFMLWVTVAVGMVPIVGMAVYAHASGLVAGAAMVVWVVLAILLPRAWWPLGVLQEGKTGPDGAGGIRGAGLGE